MSVGGNGLLQAKISVTTTIITITIKGDDPEEYIILVIRHDNNRVP